MVISISEEIKDMFDLCSRSRLLCNIRSRKNNCEQISCFLPIHCLLWVLWHSLEYLFYSNIAADPTALQGLIMKHEIYAAGLSVPWICCCNTKKKSQNILFFNLSTSAVLWHRKCKATLTQSQLVRIYLSKSVHFLRSVFYCTTRMKEMQLL